jgi:hypothetical protein
VWDGWADASVSVASSEFGSGVVSDSAGRSSGSIGNPFSSVGIDDGAALVLVLIAMLDVEVTLTRVGLRAPHGWSCVQEEAQALSLPQPFTH